jgi:hypothetical protein
MKRISLIIFALLAVVQIKAVTLADYVGYFEDDSYCYAIISEEEHTVGIYRQNVSTLPDLVIPSSVDYNGTTYTVTKLFSFNSEDVVWANRGQYETVTIPPTIKEIGGAGEVFYGMLKLEKVYISDFVAWLAIDMNSDLSNNPTWWQRKLFLNGEEVKGDIVIPEGVEVVGNCYYLDNITSVTVPSSVKKFMICAFNCPNVFIYAAEPPILIAYNDEYQYFNHSTVWVPAGSLEKYKADEKWSQVSDLREMSVDEMTAYDTNGVGDVAINNVVKVSTVDGGIAISTTEATEVAIYSTTGALVKALRVSGEETVSLAPGLYIVRAADKSYKVRV